MWQENNRRDVEPCRLDNYPQIADIFFWHSTLRAKRLLRYVTRMLDCAHVKWTWWPHHSFNVGRIAPKPILANLGSMKLFFILLQWTHRCYDTCLDGQPDQTNAIWTHNTQLRNNQRVVQCFGSNWSPWLHSVFETTGTGTHRVTDLPILQGPNKNAE